MIRRYEDKDIAEKWSNESKLRHWQETELAVIQARANLSHIDAGIPAAIRKLLEENPIDLEWWLARDKEINHDLNAFIDERLRFLPVDLQQYFHSGLTSYDTEEPAFALMLSDSISVFGEHLCLLVQTLEEMAKRYRYTIMNGRTHGQEAELQSFGKRCLTWLVALQEGIKGLRSSAENLNYSKLSGAIGNYRGLEGEVEKEALRILGLTPFYGATQIMPRELYSSVAHAICQIVLTLDKIAIDIRLGARSGRPIYQEPFGRKQKGSSAMPHKKNTIASEQLEGMARMAKGYLRMIIDNISTWEERAIEQSSVERVAWPDLLHVAVHAIKTMTKVLQGLVVYPDHMLAEIVDSCGCYAAGEAKEFLRQHGAEYGLSAEDAYRIIQLAAFNAFAADEHTKTLRRNLPESFEEADSFLLAFRRRPVIKPISIHETILLGKLAVSEQLEATLEIVDAWNSLLKRIFSDPNVCEEWNLIFTPSYLLLGEDTLFKEILGV
ncbi:MAG: lyase family protein [Candidatus Staskawiczbacteria bacterium]|jgi:adenylosuccinate lyase